MKRRIWGALLIFERIYYEKGKKNRKERVYFSHRQCILLVFRFSAIMMAYITMGNVLYSTSVRYHRTYFSQIALKEPLRRKTGICSLIKEDLLIARVFPQQWAPQSRTHPWDYYWEPA